MGGADFTAGVRASNTPLSPLARGLLVLLAFALPFEAPLFRLGPLQLTTVELVLYAMLAAWGLDSLSKFIPNGLPSRKAVATLGGEEVVRAAVLWSVVIFVSAAAAPSHRAAALKFALRSLSGVLVFFAAKDLARSPGVAQRARWALIAGALLSASTAVFEWLAPSSSSVWSSFRASDFDYFGLRRPCGVFAFPTIGAMYWEAAVPLVVVAPFVERGPLWGRSAMRRGCFALLASALLIAAILASATRSGLAGVCVACGALLVLGWRAGIGMRLMIVGVLGVLALSLTPVLSATGAGSLLGQRLRWWHDDRWFRVEYVVAKEPQSLHVGESVAVPVILRNTGTVTWPHAGDLPVRLAYHWERLEGPQTRADYEGFRTELPADLPPGGMLEVLGLVRGPAQDGPYRLHWDLVEEGVTWFSNVGNAMPEVEVDVVPASEGAPPFVVSGAPPPTVAPRPPPRSACWRAAVILWRRRPLVGIGPDNFRRSYQAVLSPAPNGQPYTDTRIHANSLYFETLADLGLAGVAALAYVACALLRLLRKHSAASDLPGLGCGVAAGAFFVHGILDYFFEFTPLFGLFWLLLGLTAAYSAPTPLARPERTR